MDDFAISVPIAKVGGDEQRLVYGWASIVEVNGQPVIDHQGDVIPVAEIQKAAHDFMANARAAGDMHERFEGVGEVVESMVLTPEVQKAIGVDLGKVGWFIGVKVDDDDVWKRVKSGELRAFSIGGRGTRVPMEE